MTDARKHVDSSDFLQAFANELRTAEVDVSRITTGVPILHPQIFSFSGLWQLHKGTTERLFRLEPDTPVSILHSPIRIAYDGGGPVRCDLTAPRRDGEFSILEDLRREGFTDYVVHSVPVVDGSHKALSLATTRRGGFDGDELALFETMIPAFAFNLEVQALRRTARTLLDTYVGQQSGGRVLEGQIRRGTGETIRAVIWLCDLRGFTKLSEALPRDALIDLLNCYFGPVCEAVVAQGGEVLKFIGDAMLAIFPIEGEAAPRCGFALDRENRQHRIPDELQDFAALRHDRVAHRTEIAIEQIDQRVARQRLGQLGEASEIAEPDHGPDGFAGAAPDLAFEYAASGLLPDIGIQQGARGAAQRLYFEIERERGDHRLQQRQFIAVEPAATRGRQRQRLVAAVGERNGVHDVIGEAFAAQIFQNRELAVAPRRGEIAAHRATAVIGDPDRAVQDRHRRVRLQTEQTFGRALVELPQATEGKNLRMQDRNAGRDARYIHLGGAQLVCEGLQKIAGVNMLARIGHQPANNRMRLVSRGRLQFNPRGRSPVSARRGRRRDGPR